MGILQEAFAAIQMMNKAGNLIKSDKAISSDLQAFLAEVGQAAKAASANPAAAPSLRQAFNDVAGLLPAANQFARDGKLSVCTMIDVLKKKGKVEKSIQILTQAVDAGDPVANGFVDTLTGSKALLRLAARTNGTVFSVQDGPDGTGVVNVLLSAPGIPDHFSLCQRDYTELKAFLKGSDNPPQPPKGPGL